MKIYLEYHDERSNKFWEIDVAGSAHTVRYGKTGADGQTKTKNFADAAAAQADADKLVAQKRKKGYREAGTAVTKQPVTRQAVTKQPVTKQAVTKQAVTKKVVTKKVAREASTLDPAALYKPLARALVAADPTCWPKGLHAGGPRAKMVAQEGPASVRLALWSAQTARAVTRGAERQALDEAIEQVEESLKLYHHLVATLPPAQVRMGKGYEQLSKRGGQLKDPKGESLAHGVARAALGAFRCIPGGYAQRAVVFAAEAAEQTVQLLREKGDSEAVSRYLAELDDRILEEEFMAAAKAKGKLDPLPEISRVVWRGADGKSLPALWLVRLRSGNYGYLAKVGSRWSYSEADRDTALASVPDDHFESAAEAVAAREGD